MECIYRQRLLKSTEKPYKTTFVYINTIIYFVFMKYTEGILTFYLLI